MTSEPQTQQERALSLLKRRGIARISELTEEGVRRTTIARMREKGLVHSSGAASTNLPTPPSTRTIPLRKRPSACLRASSVWSRRSLIMTSPIPFRTASGSLSAPKIAARSSHPPLQFVRFSGKLFRKAWRCIRSKVDGKHLNPAKTVVDLFRYRRSAGKRYRHSTGLNIALEGLREALRTRKAKPSEIADFAARPGSGKSCNLILKR